MSQYTPFISGMPKTEIHLHLEGAIPLAALWELVQKYGCPPGMDSIDRLREKFRYRDFPHFIDTWVWKNRFLREYEDFEFIARHFSSYLDQQNIRYAEVFISPGDFQDKGLKVPRIIEAIRSGMDAGRPAGTAALIVDLIRDFGPVQGERWLEEILEVRNQGVIGIGLGGSEFDFPPGAYRGVFRQAREAGLKTTVHAGEGAGPESIREAVSELQPDRIGHGTRAAEDPSLVKQLIHSRLPVEMCPHSNVCTNVVPALNRHPVKAFLEAGMLVSVNTDDPAMFNNDLNTELQELVTGLDLSREQLKQLMLNSIDSSWCGDSHKADLAAELEEWFAICE